MTTGMCHYTWLISVFFVEMEFHHVAQASLELLGLSNPPSSASQSAGIMGMNYHAWPWTRILNSIYMIFFLELYLEEIADRIIEVDMECQTDAFLDRPPTPLFIPAKTGKDVATQILEGEVQYILWASLYNLYK